MKIGGGGTENSTKTKNLRGGWVMRGNLGGGGIRKGYIVQRQKNLGLGTGLQITTRQCNQMLSVDSQKSKTGRPLGD